MFQCHVDADHAVRICLQPFAELFFGEAVIIYPLVQERVGVDEAGDIVLYPELQQLKGKHQVRVNYSKPVAVFPAVVGSAVQYNVDVACVEDVFQCGFFNVHQPDTR